MASVKQISAFRESFIRFGGTVLPAAGIVDDPDGKAALAIAGKAACTGLGWLAWIVGMSN
jgi:hypothetical protein